MKVNDRFITREQLDAFKQFLLEDEKSPATINKYMHDIRAFMAYAENKPINKTTTLSYKETPGEMYAATSANSMIAALNTFLKYNGWHDCCIKRFKLQKKAYCAEDEELTRAEYTRLIRTAERNDNTRLSLMIQTICGTGIRVSELSSITVESLAKGEAHVRSKGKDRAIFIVPQLRKKLLRYVKEKGISSGPVFITRSGRPVSRCNIWREMKSLCKEARVSPSKVFPHNLRHLFARVFYEIEKDIAKLADILGHTNINTTRIYIMTTGIEHRRRMEKMKLIL